MDVGKPDCAVSHPGCGLTLQKGDGMKNPELWVDSSGKIEEFLDAQPGAAKVGAREWHSGGSLIRIFPLMGIGKNGDGPPRTLIVLYEKANAGKAHCGLMDRFWELMDGLR